MLGLLEGSRLIGSGEEQVRKGLHRQDPYCLRCIPQVMGAARDAIGHTSRAIEVELNSANDNPLIFPEDRAVLSGGNFHGQPIAIVLDLLAIALTTVGNLIERRIARLLDPNLSLGLPPFLVPSTSKAGLNSGMMTAQYSAAALASENKILAHPASVDSIPTSKTLSAWAQQRP